MPRCNYWDEEKNKQCGSQTAMRNGFCHYHGGSNEVVDDDVELQEDEELEDLQAQIAAQRAEIEALKAQVQVTAANAAPAGRKSPQRIALEKELKRLNLEKARHLKKQIDYMRSGRKGLPPMYLDPLPQPEDATSAPKNEDGSRTVPEGAHCVWVSLYDRQGRDASDPEQVRRRKQIGYKIATYDDGREVRDSGFGLLMYTENPAVAAAWTHHHMPPGAVNPVDYTTAQLEDDMRQANRELAHGEEVVTISRGDRHGEYQTESLWKP